MAMTYRELIDQLSLLSDEQLNETVTLYQHPMNGPGYNVDEEYIPITGVTFTVGDDVLHDNHTILVCNPEEE